MREGSGLELCCLEKVKGSGVDLSSSPAPLEGSSADLVFTLIHSLSTWLSSSSSSCCSEPITASAAQLIECK